MVVLWFFSRNFLASVVEDVQVVSSTLFFLDEVRRGAVVPFQSETAKCEACAVPWERWVDVLMTLQIHPEASGG